MQPANRQRARLLNIERFANQGQGTLANPVGPDLDQDVPPCAVLYSTGTKPAG